MVLNYRLENNLSPDTLHLPIRGTEAVGRLLRWEIVRPNKSWTPYQVDSIHKGTSLLLHHPVHRGEIYIQALDPGETTGSAIAYVVDGTLRSILLLQWDTSDLKDPSLYKCLQAIQPPNIDHLVMEDYRVYGFKADSHKWSELHTAKLIGVFLSSWYNPTHQKGGLLPPNKKPPTFRMAQPVKHFVTDKKLEEWGMYTTMKHARDALRHFIFEFLFCTQKEKDSP